MTVQFPAKPQSLRVQPLPGGGGGGELPFQQIKKKVYQADKKRRNENKATEGEKR